MLSAHKERKDNEYFFFKNTRLIKDVLEKRTFVMVTVNKIQIQIIPYYLIGSIL